MCMHVFLSMLPSEWTVCVCSSLTSAFLPVCLSSATLHQPQPSTAAEVYSRMCTPAFSLFDPECVLIFPQFLPSVPLSWCAELKPSWNSQCQWDSTVEAQGTMPNPTARVFLIEHLCIHCNCLTISVSISHSCLADYLVFLSSCRCTSCIQWDWSLNIVWMCFLACIDESSSAHGSYTEEQTLVGVFNNTVLQHWSKSTLCYSASVVLHISSLNSPHNTY